MRRRQASAQPYVKSLSGRWIGLDVLVARALLRIVSELRDHGKCVIFIFETKEDFVVFEKQAFNYNAHAAAGVCHQRGHHVYVSFFKGGNDARFASVLIHENVHAFMYRYRTPMALPTWANEGLADFVAGHLVRESPEPLHHWRHAREFVLAGGDAREIMAQSYLDGTWFDGNSYPVSHMLVRFMLKYRARAFKEWIDDVKAGVEWTASMSDRFGVTPGVLAQGFAKEMRSERSYTRVR